MVSGIGQRQYQLALQQAVLGQMNYFTNAPQFRWFYRKRFRCTDYFRNGKEKATGFTKGRDRSFILVPNNTRLLE
jgi:hypothetical protein